MRRPHKKINHLKEDRVYGSKKLSQFINYIMLDGKKTIAEKIVYKALENIKEKEGVKDPLSIFEEALRKTGPEMEVKSRRIGGANYQVPVPVKVERQISLAMRWIIGAVRKKSGKPTAEILAGILLESSKGEWEAVKKREDTHRMAEANKAFAHFAW